MRQRAADDFDAIRKRLLELQGKKLETEPSSVPVTKQLIYTQQQLADLVRQISPLSKDERFAVAKMFNCQWRLAADNGCGRNGSKMCIKNGRCMNDRV